MNKIRYFIDSEFIETNGHLEPISIGIKCSDGREFYGINSEFDISKSDEWVLKNVISKLPPKENRSWLSRSELASSIGRFINQGISPDSKIEFWSYFASYDWVIFCWMMGGKMIDLPKHWPMHIMDLKQSMVERGVEKSQLPKREGSDKHDALSDARWHYEVWKSIYLM